MYEYGTSIKQCVLRQGQISWSVSSTLGKSLTHVVRALNKWNMTGTGGGPFRMISAYTAYTAHTVAMFLYTCSYDYGRTC